MPVTLINVFSVPKEKEDEFVKWWQDVKATITKQPGFMSGKFHRSIKPDSNSTSLTSRCGKMKRCTGRPMKRASRRCKRS